MVKEIGGRISAGDPAIAMAFSPPDTRWPRRRGDPNFRLFRDRLPPCPMLLAMPAPARLFRVPCRCSATVTIGPGQAGSQVPCPGCGSPIDVPRLRELATFAVPAGPASGPGWRPGEAWLLMGSLLALVAGLAAAIVGSFDGGASQWLPGDEVIREVIESADVATIYAAWQAMRTAGVDRGAIPAEARVQRSAGSTARVAGLLWALAAAGGVAAAGGGIACLRPRPGAPPEGRP